jgi:uncharacterized protein (TIGR00369 family)
MSIWKRPLTLEGLAAISRQTAISHLGIEFLEVGPDFLRGRVPVDERTRQPYGLLHGGVSGVLAETLGSCAAHHCLPEGLRAVGLEINANHLRSAESGWVAGVARPLRLGSRIQVWQIDMEDMEGRPTCVSRLTVAVLGPDAMT